jgi:hypothetical protein
MKKYVYVFAALSTLTACGYSPLYAPTLGQGAGQGASFSSRVQVAEVAMFNPEINPAQRRVAGQISQRLRLDFPHTNPSADVLTVSIEETTSALAVQRSASVARAQITLTGYVKLTNPEGAQLLNTSLSSKASYNVENSPFSTESGKTFAEATAAKNLAEEIARRLVLFYRTAPASK